jgi:hypothetical protein
MLCGGLAFGLDVPIVFVSRDFEPGHDPAASAAVVERARSGKLLVWPANGVPAAIVDATSPSAAPETPVDVASPAVSWAASRIVFAGFSAAENAWRIFEVGADGTGLRQITRSDRTLDLSRYGAVAGELESYDDVDPCYLPDGRICLVSTRYPGIVPDGRRRTTNLYVVNADGTDLHRITTERFGADTPTVDPSTGRIVYSRWWRTVQAVADSAGQSEVTVDKAPPPPIPPGGYYGNPPPPVSDPKKVIVTNADNITSSTVLRGIADAAFSGVNSWFLASIKPDGTGLQMHSGFRLDRQETQAYRPRFLWDGQAVALFINEAPFLGFPGRSGLRTFSAGAGKPTPLGGPQRFDGADASRQGFVYASAEPLPDGTLLVTATPSGERRYGIYLKRGAKDEPQLLFEWNSLQELDAVPLVAREAPPVLQDDSRFRPDEETPFTAEEAYARGSFKFISENIHFNGPVGMAIASAPPVGKRLSIEFYMQPQKTNGFPADRPILLGTKEIGPDGRVEMELPAGVPLFEIIRRTDGLIAQGRDGQVFHVGGLNYGQTGREAHCVGCHAGHTLIEPGEDVSWTNLAPSAIVTASSTRSDAPPFFEAKALVDRRTDAIVSEWAAGTIETNTYLQFRWSVPIKAKAVRVYAPAAGNGLLGKRDQVIQGFEVSTYRRWFDQEHFYVRGPVSVKGREAPLNPEIEIDGLIIAIARRDVSGLYEDQPAPALAEVEVIAKVAGNSEPVAYFVRGDSNCDTEVNLTDVIGIIGSLFLGGGTSCCSGAADANADLLVDLGDPIYLLNHLFRSGPSPRSPFPDCGPAPIGDLMCDREVCK